MSYVLNRIKKNFPTHSWIEIDAQLRVFDIHSSTGSAACTKCGCEVDVIIDSFEKFTRIDFIIDSKTLNGVYFRQRPEDYPTCEAVILKQALE